MAKINLKLTASGSSSAMANLSVLSNLSVWHLVAAADFAHKAGEIETINSGKPFGDFYQEIASNVMAAVFFSVAALEASINELFKNSKTTISEQTEELTQEIWDLFEQKTSLLDKYDLALLLKGKNKLDKGIAVYANTAGLISLRNALVHFKPEWSHEQKKHKTIGNKLSGKFAVSPFIPVGDTFFPKKCMSYGCAEWSVKTALKFTTHFCNQAGLPDRFAPFLSQLKTK